MAEQVTAPQRRPRVGGIKSVIGDFIPESRLSVVNAAGGLAWEDAGCGLPSNTRAGCYDDVVLPAAKTAEGPVQYGAIGDPFAQYKGVECYLGGDAGGDSYQAQAEAVLEQGEERDIEMRLSDWAQAGPDPETKATLLEAIAQADSYADSVYVGQPIMLLSRAEADLAFAAGVLVRDSNGNLITGNGTPVISSGAIGTGAARVVGAIAVWVTPTKTGVGRDLTTNVEMAIAERVYAIGVDCDFRHIVWVDAP